jgi:HEAT repeat protein
MSGGPAWEGSRPTIFERDEALVAIEPLIESKSADIADAAVTVFGRDSPYFYDQDVPFWLVGIGKGHITGLGARKRPANLVVADIGAKELLQVATNGMTPNLRALAIRALGRRPHAYPAAIVAVWARDPSVEVRRAAVLASADVPDREPIVAASTDGSPDTRSTAAVAVGFAQDPHLLPLLKKLLLDSVADVRSTAALSLLSYPVDQAAPVMEANLTSDFRYSSTRSRPAIRSHMLRYSLESSNRCRIKSASTRWNQRTGSTAAPFLPPTVGGSCSISSSLARPPS